MDAPLLVLYGSQTGNAQDVSERLGREAELLLFKPRVMSMDAYDVTQLPTERLVLFVASTTGQGEPPANMRRFWRFLLRKSLPPGSLTQLQCAVFGLGDSGYPLFNAAAKKLSRRLEALGARLLLDTGLGDDQHPSGYEAALDAWAAVLWPSLRGAAGPLPPGMPTPEFTPSTVPSLGRPKFHVTLLPPGPAPPAGSTAAAAAPLGSWRAAVQAGVAFRRVALTASGGLQHAPPSTATEAPQAPEQQGPPQQGPDGAAHRRYGPEQPYMAQLVACRRLTAAVHFQDTRHVELDLGESNISYQPGNVLALLPRTPPADVEALLARLGLDGDQRVRVTPAASHHAVATALHAANSVADASDGDLDLDASPWQQHLPLPAGRVRDGAGAVCCCEATVRDLVQGALDVAGASPRRYFFQVLSFFARDAMHRERLRFFASAEGRDDLYTYCKREGRTVLEVLQDFGSCHPPLERLLEACPPLLPRLFSISSSQRLHPTRVHLTVALVEYRTPYRRLKRGLCSTYLASLTPAGGTAALQDMKKHTAVDYGSLHQHSTDSMGGDLVACWVEQGSLRMPIDPGVPLILVGPGTGVAPFRSFLQERLAIVQQGHATSGAPALPPGQGTAVLAEPPPLAPCCLYFGCRGPKQDCYYADEWRELQLVGVLAGPPEGLVLAFSQQHGQPKVYVTHRLREHGAHVWQLLSAQPGACMYVSGSAKKMPADVAAALRDVCQEHGMLGKEEAAAFVRRLELTGRYQVEAWS